MKLYQKKEEKNSIVSRIIITMLFFLIPSIIIIYYYLNSESLIDFISSIGLSIIFILFFISISFYSVFYFFKKPKKYIATLIKKNVEYYNDEEITYMTFIIQNDEKNSIIPSSFKCYTNTINNYIVDNKYILGLKEFNWEPKYVEEVDFETDSKNISEEMPRMNLLPIYILVYILIISLLLFSIYSIIMYPNKRFMYIGLLFIVIYALIFIYKKKNNK